MAKSENFLSTGRTSRKLQQKKKVAKITPAHSTVGHTFLKYKSMKMKLKTNQRNHHDTPKDSYIKYESETVFGLLKFQVVAEIS